MFRVRFREAMQSASAIVRAQLRAIVPVGVVVLVGVVIVAIIAGAYAQLIGVTAYSNVLASIKSGGVSDTTTWAIIGILIPLVLLTLLLSLVWAGTAVHAANAALERRRVSMLSAAWSALRNSPRALAVIAITVGAALGAILIAPLLVIVGVVGLLLRKRAAGSRMADRWPSRGSLIAMAIPFGVAVLVLVRWSLALSGVWLRGLGVRASLADSSARVRGRGPEVAVLMLLALLLSFGLSEGAVLVVASFWHGQFVAFGVQLVALVLFGSLPLTALAVLSRDNGKSRNNKDDRPDPLPAPRPRKARIAAAVTVTLLIPFMIGVTSSPASASGTAVGLSADSTTTVAGEELTLTATVTGNSPTGDVTFDAVPTSGPDVVLGTQSVDGTGKSVLQIYHLPVGVYGIVVNYEGDSNNPAASSTPLAHTVNFASVTIDVTANPPATAGSTTLFVSVAAVAPAFLAPTGTITVSGGGNALGPVVLDASGNASQAVDVTSLGARDLSISYSGDDAYASQDKSFSVPKIPTTMDVFGLTHRGATYGDSQTYAGSVTSSDGTTPTGTVDLIWYNNAVVASTQLDDLGNFSITTSNLRVSSQHIFVAYEGDDSHAGSDNTAPVDLISLDLVKAASVPVVSISPSTPAIGDHTTVTATLDNLGDGPTGTVTFTSDTGDVLGAASVSGTTASIDFVPKALTTFITASYSGDINFLPEASDPFRQDATQAEADVAILDPGTLTNGQIFDLTATVSVAGGALTPDHGVTFTKTGGDVIASNVTVIAGKATVSVCAGAAADCPLGTIALGASATTITASYAASTVNLLGTSAPYAYSAGQAATTTALVVNPSTVIFGSAVFLQATVTNADSSATPTGHVTFYGVKPVAGGGTAESFLGSADLVDGVAQLETSSGDQLTQLRWPANQVEADYDPDGANFQASSDSKSITLGRVGVSLSVNATPQPAGTATTVSVTLSHDQGAIADFTGEVTVTADTGNTCTAFPASGSHQVSCQITWTVVGTHSVTASYSGDVVYLPGAASPFGVDAEKATPLLGSSVDSRAVENTDVTVTWNEFDASAGGTVTVFGDGHQWCSVSVLALSCTGQFGSASATGSVVDVVVRYSGDSNWNGLQETHGVIVSRCATLDVHSNDHTLGTVQVNTAPNCGSGGFVAGTTVSVTATPIAPAVFEHWNEFRSGALEAGSTAATTSFVVTNDALTWVHYAQFAIPCDTVTAAPTGFGDLYTLPGTNCTNDDGVAGFLYGTHISIFPNPGYDPRYGEKDAFRSFGTLPAGASLSKDTDGFDFVALTVKTPTVIPINFGPQCRPVTVKFDPASPGDSVTAGTPVNCFSPFGDGYLNGTVVTTSVTSGDPTLAITGWSLNGVAVPSLGTTSTPKVVVDSTAPVLTATLVHCYSVTVAIDGVADRKSTQVGDVRVDGPPNCPDGSARFVAGTQVTLTPEILVSGGSFNGWDNTLIGNATPVTGATGDVTQDARTFAIQADIQTTAGFYLDSECSRLTIVGDPDLVTFSNTGCGPGFYADIRKQFAKDDGVDPSTLWQEKYHTEIPATINRTQKLDVYVGVRGDTRGCFGVNPSSAGPSTGNPLDWNIFGPLVGSSTSCRIAGSTSVWAQACQSIVTTPAITVAGDASGHTFDGSSIPGTFYLVGADGYVHGFSMVGFSWAQPTPIEISATGTVTQTDIAPGPCHDAGTAFPAGTDLSVSASGPATGFAFMGWSGANVGGGDHGGLYAYNPIALETTDTQRSVTNTAHYTVTCHTVTLGEGLSIVGDAPRCPGSSDADNSYIAGTAIQIRAVHQLTLGDRILAKFEKGVVADQISEDPDTKDLTAFALVDSDKSVTGEYLTQSEYNGLGFIQGLKFAVGIMAIAAPIFLSIAFPPVGIALSVLAVGAGIANFIPGGGKAAAVFDLLNPTNITTCAARWAFTNSGNPTGGKNFGADLSLENTIRKVADGADVLNEPLGPLGAAGGLASFGLGLYTAGIGHTDFSTQTVEQLAGTSTMTGCLNDQWRAADANVGG